MPRGGARAGAGRRAKPKLPKLTKCIASEVLQAIGGEKRWWMSLLATPDQRLRFDVLKYLTDRRDGRPIQQVRIANSQDEVFKVEIDVTSIREKLLGKLG